MWCGVIGLIILVIDEVLILVYGLESKKERMWFRIVGVVLTSIYLIWIILIYIIWAFAY